MRNIRIGSGAGYGGDRIEPAIDLIKHGNLDYIIFECLAERTISIAQKRKLENPQLGYNDLLEYRFERILPLLKEHPVKVITNMGAANPRCAAAKCRQMADSLGLTELKIAWVSGDDITERLEDYLDLETMEMGRPLRELKGEVLSCNGYIGCEAVVRALEKGADIVITGRIADPSLTLGPLVYEFGWSMEDYVLLGKGTVAGHLLECAGQVTGGYFADPGYKDVPELWDLGFPIAEVSEDGTIVISKLPQAGGMVTTDTVKEQLLYEIQDPASYYTPDVTADFTEIRVRQLEKDRVEVVGGSGKAPNGFYKTSVGYHDCFIGIGQISYGGSNALRRAELAKEILEKRFEMTGLKLSELRFDYIGINSLYGDRISSAVSGSLPTEIRLRAAARTDDLYSARRIGEEVEALYTNGPAGGGGVEKQVKDIISIASVLIPAEDFRINVDFI